MNAIHSVRCAARLLVSLCMSLPFAATLGATEQRFGMGGWRLERFEGDLAILRATVSDESNRRRGILLLSCAGAQRSLQIGLPTRLRGGSGKTRWALIKPIGPPAATDSPILVRLLLQHGRNLSLSETDTGPTSVVLSVADLLRSKPPALEMLTRDGASAVSPRAIVPYVFVLTFDPRDAIALDHFADACRLRGP